MYSFFYYYSRRTSGKCFLARDKQSRELFVLKEMELSDEQMKLCAFREVKLLSELRHPNIVEYKTHFVTKDTPNEPNEKGEGDDSKKEKLCMVMEYCDGGDLLQKLIRYSKRGKTIREEKILKYLTQLLLAVEYIHSKNILHRDIKSQNIFLFADKHIPVKLGDFGISKELSASLDRTASTVIGTPYYMSPEILSGQHYSFASDMWAVGCVLFEMMTLEHAFRGGDYHLLVQSIVRGQVPPLPQAYSTELKALTLSLLSTDPQSRPSAAQALGLPFMRRFMISKVIEFRKAEGSARRYLSAPPPPSQQQQQPSQLSQTNKLNNDYSNDASSDDNNDSDNDVGDKKRSCFYYSPPNKRQRIIERASPRLLSPSRKRIMKELETAREELSSKKESLEQKLLDIQREKELETTLDRLVKRDRVSGGVEDYGLVMENYAAHSEICTPFLSYDASGGGNNNSGGGASGGECAGMDRMPIPFPALPPRLCDRACVLSEYCREALGDELFEKACEYFEGCPDRMLSKDDPVLKKIIGETPAFYYAQALVAFAFIKRCLKKTIA